MIEIQILLKENKSKLILDEPASVLTIFNIFTKINNKINYGNIISATVNDEILDFDFIVKTNSEIKFITDLDGEGVSIIRHSYSHLMANAIFELFPDTKFGIGPVIENGFYYDFLMEKQLSITDLGKIEKHMRELIKQDIEIKRIRISKDSALALFKENFDKYKLEIISDLDQNEVILYKQGNFIDLCRGPHVYSTGVLAKYFFKLMKISGSYWKGNSLNDSMQRIYGVAWVRNDDLNKYLEKIKMAEKADHRKLGKSMDLFHFQEDSPGMVFWHKNGWTIFKIIVKFIRKLMLKNGYDEVNTPQLLNQSLWVKSGHWEKFGLDNMFITKSEKSTYAIKPMNCPGHIQIYNKGIKSHKDLPIRIAEFGTCYRNEPSGTLHGLMRIRCFTQDDAHIFCKKSDVKSELIKFIEILYSLYKRFGFTNIIIKVATRPEKRLGTEFEWDFAENVLIEALEEKNIKWEISKGEGTFYGPKIEFLLKDSLDRIWQCGTIQYDFNMSKRLNAVYIDNNGEKQNTIILHRVIVGSIERFIGILLEHYVGNLPIWLAPTQVAVLNITDRNNLFANEVFNKLFENGIRVICDLRNEKIGYKIRENSILKIPYFIIIGDKEEENNLISVRKISGENIGQMTVKSFIELISKETNHIIE